MDRGVLYDRLDYYEKDDSDLATDIVKEYKDVRNLTIIEMIEELDQVNDEDVNADFTQNEKVLRGEILKIMIAQKLDFKSNVEYMRDVIDELFELQQQEIDELKKQARHRHKTVFGLYTEKAVY